MTSDNPLPFTGERFTPECVREIAYEHWHRYAFASFLSQGKRVLDAACGEGYGSAVLARNAASVIGIDIDQVTIDHANSRYQASNLHFECRDVIVLDDFSDASFDLIVSFETLEHLREQEKLLAGFHRLLNDNGLLLISTPDKHTYTDLTGQVNPHHIRELYRNEFEALLQQYFSAHKLYGHKLLFASALWSMDGHAKQNLLITDKQTELEQGLIYPPVYYLAACAKNPMVLNTLPDLSIYSDVIESVYRHYNDSVRDNIKVGHQFIELQQRLDKFTESGTDERIGVVVVSYFSESTLARCLASLLSDPSVTDVVVVDNGSMDQSRQIIRDFIQRDPRVTLIEDDDNPGFAAACNAGVWRLNTPWLAFVNPDLYVDADSLTRLRELAKQAPQLGIISADIVDNQGVRDVAVRRRDPVPKTLIAGGLRASSLAVPIEADLEIQPVEATSGALMLMPRAVFAQVGGWDSGYRLHIEDLDLCRRVRAAGFTVAVANQVRVLHERGVSSRRRPFWVERQKAHGLWRYWRRFDGKNAGFISRLLASGLLAMRYMLIAPIAWWRSR